MPTIRIGNRRLYYARQTTRGEARRRPALVLIHGAGGSHLDWPAGLRRVPGTTVLALDLPGHGRSDPPGAESIDDYAGTVETFLDAVDVDPAVLVGHSMGGAIAQASALRRPLGGLILIGTGARLRVSPAILDRLPAEHEAVAAALARAYWSATAPADWVARSAERLRSVSPDVLRGDFLACDGFDLRERLGAIDVPALVVAATGDRLTPPALARELADRLPQARLLTLEGAGHMMALERPGPLVAAVEDFLDELADR